MSKKKSNLIEELNDIRFRAGIPLVEEEKSEIGYKTDIEADTIANNTFRRVLYTANHIQLVLMSIPPGGDIGEEVHPDTDQFLRFESGEGQAILDGRKISVTDGDSVIVPAGTKHNFINTGSSDLKLYSIYSPPHHQKNTIHRTKEEAMASKEEFDGETDS